MKTKMWLLFVALVLFSVGSAGAEIIRVSKMCLDPRMEPAPREIRHAAASSVTLHVRGGQNVFDGSGVVLDKQGYVLTAAHVVNMPGKLSIIVELANCTSLEGQLVYMDSLLTDMAIVKIMHPPKNLTPIRIGKKQFRHMSKGDQVYALGAPRGVPSILSGTFLTGYFLDSSNNKFSPLPLVMTDVGIQPGSSGGALVDKDGYLIAMTEGCDGKLLMDVTREGEKTFSFFCTGNSYFVPINAIARVLEKLDIPAHME